MKYYDGQEVKECDLFQGKLYGTCRLVILESPVSYARNLKTLELFQIHEDGFTNCDLLERF